MSFLKFYADGRIIYGESTEKKGPVPGRYADTTFDLAGFYKLNGREIVTELSYGFTGNDWTILVSRGRIAGDTIIFYKDQIKWRGKNEKRFSDLRRPGGQKCYYIKSAKKEDLLTPDW